MNLYNGTGNIIEIGGSSSDTTVYTHTAVKCQEVAGATTETVIVEGCVSGTLMFRGGGSCTRYTIYNKEGEVLLSDTDWGAGYVYPSYEGDAYSVEISPTDYATVVWKVNRTTLKKLPNDYRYGRVLAWSDEFNEGKLDSSKWYEEKAYNRRGSERGDGTNAFVQNNELHLRIMREHQYLENHTEREWSGTVLHSHFHYKYGLAEARIKFADCGAWMSFWAVGANMDEYPEAPFINGVPWAKCGEIDFVECNGGLGVSGAIHYNNGQVAAETGSDEEKGNDSSISVYSNTGFDAMSDYHIYSCEWTDETITMYIDYHRVGSANVANLKTSDTYNAFQLAQRILFSCQPVIPGNYNNRVPQDGVNKLEGVVDWVRVYAPVGWENIEPTGLLIDGNDGSQIVELTVGEVHDCIVTIEPERVVNQSTTWTTSIPEVVAISRTGGRLTALKEGYSTITAKMWNGVQTSIVVHVTALTT